MGEWHRSNWAGGGRGQAQTSQGSFGIDWLEGGRPSQINTDTTTNRRIESRGDRMRAAEERAAKTQQPAEREGLRWMHNYVVMFVRCITIKLNQITTRNFIIIYINI
jgi:hypothetical protein